MGVIGHAVTVWKQSIMSSSTPNELWYASRLTRLVYMPPKLLETFGETHVVYNVVSPLEESEGRLKIRRGVVKAARPRVITPHYFQQQMLENFGDDARSYLEQVLSRKDTMRILQYGLCFEKEERSEEEVGGEVEEVAGQIAAAAQDDLASVQGVLIGPDGYWEVSLMVFINALVQRSVPHNAQEMAGRGLFDLGGGLPMGVRQELDSDFAQADTLSKANELGSKLRDYGVFDQYEDRFFELYRRLRGK